MSVERITVNVVDPDGKWLYRVGGTSALVIGIGYIIIFPLFALVGAPPSGGEVWLKYLEGKTTVWWISFWIESERVDTTAIVRACDGGVGMGIDFTGMDMQSQERLQRYLEKLDTESKS